MNIVVLDFETYFDKDITLKKLNYTEYVPKAEPLCISVIHEGKLFCVSDEKIKLALDGIDWTNTICVGHNLLFDALVLKHWYRHEAAYYIDTLGMARLLYPSMDHDLGTLAREFTDMEKMSEDLTAVKGRHWDDLSPDEQNKLKNYCKNDTLITAKLYEKWIEETPQQELDLINHTIKTFINPTLILDIEKASAAVALERQETNEQIIKYGLDKEKIRSDARFCEHLQTLGYTAPTKWSTKQQKHMPALAKNDPAFQEFYNQNPDIQELLDLKRTVNSNIKESRTLRLITAANLHHGRIPIGYNYHGAFTGRFSGANKLNMQNLPRGSILRDAIMAPDGHLIVVSDLSQIEARVLAWLAGEEKILTAFREKRDLYCEVASQIFNRPVNKKNNPDERFVGKSAVLGLGYGMSAPKFQAYCALQGRKLEQTFCYNVVDTYRKTYCRIPELWKLTQEHMHLLCGPQETKVGKLTFSNDCIVLPTGRKLRYQGLHYDDSEQSWRLINGKRVYGALIVENIVQAISRDILCEQLLAIHAHYPVIMHTHDELIACVPETEAETALAFLINIMTTPPTWASTLPLDAEAHYGKRYGDCK
jgi:DNA polymerase